MFVTSFAMKCSTFSSEIGSSINASSSKTPPHESPTATFKAADLLSGDVLVQRSPPGTAAIPNSQSEDVSTSQPTLDAAFSRLPAAVNTESLVEDSYKGIHPIVADVNDHQSLSAVVPSSATSSSHLVREAPRHTLTTSANQRRLLDMAPRVSRTSTSKHTDPSSGRTTKLLPEDHRTSHTPANVPSPSGFSSQQVLKQKRAARIASGRTTMIDGSNLAAERPATSLQDPQSFNTSKLSANDSHNDPAALERAPVANRPASNHRKIQEVGFSTHMSVGEALQPGEMNGKTLNHGLVVSRTMLRSPSKSSNFSKQDASTADQKRASLLSATENTSKPVSNVTKTTSKVIDMDSSLWDVPVSPKRLLTKSVAAANGRRTAVAKKTNGTAGRKSKSGLVEQDESGGRDYIDNSLQPPPANRRTTRASGKFEPLLELGQSTRKSPQRQMEGGARTRPLPKATVSRHKTTKNSDVHADPTTESIEAFEASMTGVHDGRSDDEPLNGSEQDFSLAQPTRDHECEVVPASIMDNDPLPLSGLDQANAAADDHAGEQKLYSE